MFVLFADVLTLALLAVVSYQDFRYRLISWWTLPLIFGSQVFISFTIRGGAETLSGIAFNVLFLLLQFFLLFIYFSIRKKRLETIVDKYLGLGDILFFLTLTPSYSFVNFFTYYFITLFCVLTVYGLSLVSRVSSNKHIPLAGFAAIFFGICILVKLKWPTLNYYDDSFILKLLGFWKI